MAAMRLTPWEEERLLVFTAAELARRHRAAGLELNAPEAIALICDAMFEAARAGASYEAVAEAGRAAVGPTEVMPGVRELVEDVRLEVLMGDGVRLVVVLDPLGDDDARDPDGPGAIRTAGDGGKPPDVATADLEAIELPVRSESDRVIRVTSHYPFESVNRRLVFDRDAAHGRRLDLPAGATERWSPGETRTVRLVRFRGEGGDR